MSLKCLYKYLYLYLYFNIHTVKTADMDTLIEGITASREVFSRTDYFVIQFDA